MLRIKDVALHQAQHVAQWVVRNHVLVQSMLLLRIEARAGWQAARAGPLDPLVVELEFVWGERVVHLALTFEEAGGPVLGVPMPPTPPVRSVSSRLGRRQTQTK